MIYIRITVLCLLMEKVNINLIIDLVTCICESRVMRSNLVTPEGQLERSVGPL